MWVVKLGGSLDAAGHLREWAQALAEAEVPLILVPGGGRFANAVRAAQGDWDLDDATAHRMAILAMEQTAHLLCGLCHRLIPATGLMSRGAHLPRRHTRVWLPAADLLGEPDILQGWEVTSDSLAAILARRTGAEALALVKSAPLDSAPSDVRALQAAGILDAAFDRYGAECGCPVWLLPGVRSNGLNALTRGEPGAGAGLRVLFNEAGGGTRDRVGAPIPGLPSPTGRAISTPTRTDSVVTGGRKTSAHSRATEKAIDTRG